MPTDDLSIPYRPADPPYEKTRNIPPTLYFFIVLGVVCVFVERWKDGWAGRRRNNRSKLTGMVDLKPWLAANGLTVRDFALGLDVPLKTAQDWVYRGVVPSTENQDKLTEYVHEHCAHHWVIAVPNGPISEGTCQRCGHQKGFQNSIHENRWPSNKAPTPTHSAVQRKSAA